MSRSLPRRLRQRFLTALLFKHPQGLTRAEVLAKIFILTRHNEFARAELYDFFYRSEKYSSLECSLDLEELATNGFLRRVAERYVAPAALPLPRKWQDWLEEFMFLENPRLPANTLSEYINKKYPPNLAQTDTPGAIFTVGYEGRSFDNYIQQLLTHSIKLLVDVRYNPYSRKPLFGRGDFHRYLPLVGIDYRHLKNLGIPGTQRRANISRTDLFARYRRDLSKFPGDMALMQELLGQQRNLALTCFELQPEHCHRHCLAAELARTTPRPIRHIC